MISIRLHMIEMEEVEGLKEVTMVLDKTDTGKIFGSLNVPLSTQASMIWFQLPHKVCQIRVVVLENAHKEPLEKNTKEELVQEGEI